MSSWIEECSERDPLLDPLRAVRSTPVKDEEANCLEELCESATPGPLLIDDEADGEGVIVATLPDGRHIISLSVDTIADEEVTVQANARLICHARYVLQRLLRDRSRWQREREGLLERIEALEAALQSQPESVDWHNPPRATAAVSRPR